MKQWMLVYDQYGRAVEKIAAAVQQNTGYVPLCSREAKADYNVIHLRTDPAVQGFRIQVDPYDEQADFQQISLTAQDSVHLRYAAADFENYYLPYAKDAEYPCIGKEYYYFKYPFQEPLKPYCQETKPRLRRRGIWTWGHKIYDYRRFIDNMADLKLNTLILWNDYVPVNVGQVIEYAHENGVEIYLGFAWGWDTVMPDISKWPEIAEAVLRMYREQYARIPCDGIYFQTFTEHTSDMMNGLVVAEAAVDMVNRISGAILAEQPDRRILFGLHATSVMKRLDTFRRLDPRVSILWEDAGAFPYHYMPTGVENFEETKKRNQQLQSLRSGGFGAVLKGVICLDWGVFRHQDGPFILGGGDAAKLEIPPKTQAIYHELQAYWIRNGHYAQDLLRTFREDAMVTCLIEDGYFEKAVSYPAALYAQMLWDSTEPAEQLMSRVALRPDVTFF